MAKQTGITDRLYWHGTDISGDVGAIQSISTNVALLPLTAINSETEERTQGQSSGAINFVSWFNDELSLPILDDLPSTDVILLYARGVSIGSPCFALSAKQVNHDPQRGQDGSLTLPVDAQGSGVAGEYGRLLTAGQHTFADSNATEPAGVVESQTTYGGVGYLQVESLGSGSPTYILEDSDDTTTGSDGNWATLLTFDGGTAPFGERKTVTGTVEQGVRCGTPTGTYTNAVVVAGFRRGSEGDREDLS